MNGNHARMERATLLHRQGQIQQARTLYEQVLLDQPTHHGALHFLGVADLQQRRFADARRRIELAIELAPTIAQYHYNLASAQLGTGSRLEAIRALERATTLDRRYVQAWVNLGIARFELGLNEPAREALGKALALDPSHALARLARARVATAQRRGHDALADLDAARRGGMGGVDVELARADALASLGQVEQAAAALGNCLAMPKPPVGALIRLAWLRLSSGQEAAAHALCDRAEQTGGHTAAEWRELSVLQQALSRHAQAQASLRMAIEQAPDDHQLHADLGSMLLLEQRAEAAIEAFDAALRVLPTHVASLSSRGLAHLDLHHDAAARADLERAIELDPHFAHAHLNLAIWHQAHGDAASEQASLEAAIAVDPGGEGHLNLALSLLSRFEFERGWQAFEWRTSGLQRVPSRAGVWDGHSPVERLQVIGEQGIGDQLLFASLLPELQQTVGRIELAVDAKLQPLLARSLPEVDVRPRAPAGATPQGAWIPLGSLGAVLRRSAADFARAPRGYLQPDRARLAGLRAAVRADAGKVCGVSWRSTHQQYGRVKSAPLHQMARALARVDGMRLVNLQYGDTTDDVEQARAQGLAVHTVEGLDAYDDIDGLACALSLCDVVVTTSNSTAHLAAALGCETYVLVPATIGRYWYWCDQDGRCLWYPSVRVLRQSARDDWQTPLDALSQSLQAKTDWGQPPARPNNEGQTP